MWCSQMRRVEEIWFALNLCSLAQISQSSEQKFWFELNISFLNKFPSSEESFVFVSFDPTCLHQVTFWKKTSMITFNKKMMYWFKWPWMAFSEVTLLSWKKTNEARPPSLPWHFSDRQHIIKIHMILCDTIELKVD